MSSNQPFTWELLKAAQKDLHRIAPNDQKRIINWLDGHIYLSDNPRQYGKALVGEFKTLWRYRVGNYRIIADIDDGHFLVLVIKVGQRGNVYKQ